ncbi:uncharacterized protein METZ01_LOCUS342255 [marine metagenome]|uniref:Uncharacterized protein n=1 Tax=marine metagenome TaxID=408172 RepID=A0A382QYK2_9ZZZZ
MNISVTTLVGTQIQTKVISTDAIGKLWLLTHRVD